MSIDDFLPRDTCAEHPSRCPVPGYGDAFFVSVRDGKRVGILAGPYPSHPLALSAVNAVTDLAYGADARSHFYAFGTCKAPAKSAAVFGIVVP